MTAPGASETSSARLAGAWALALCLALVWTPGARGEEPAACTEDAMLIVDASQSMAAADAGSAGLRRIDSVRSSLVRILPRVAPRRRLGLMSYGPGSRAPCSNVSLLLRPQLDAGAAIRARAEELKPAGRTPLTRAVRMAAEALDYRAKPATIVLLTDGEESCGGDPCALAKALKAGSPALTVHVVSYRIGASLGSSGIFEARCIADETGGLYVAADTADELVTALEKVLACPFVSEALSADALARRSAARATSAVPSMAGARATGRPSRRTS